MSRKPVVIDVEDRELAAAVTARLDLDGWSVVGLNRSAAESGNGGVLGPPDGGVRCVSVCDPAGALRHRGDAAGVVVVASTAEEALRVALEIGSKGAIAWPAESGLLGEAVSLAAANLSGPAGAPRVVAISSVRSCGATALAANLSPSLERRGISAVVVDADLVHADLTGLLIEGDPAVVVEELISNRVESARPTLHAVTESKRVKLIPARGACISRQSEGSSDLSDDLSEIGTVCRHLVAPGGDFDLAIVDVPSPLMTASILDERASISWIDRVLLLVPLDFAGLRRARRILEVAPPETVDRIMPIALGRRQEAISLDDFAGVIGIDPFAEIPEGGVAIESSLDEGRLLTIRPTTPFGRAVEALAEEIVGICRPGGGESRVAKGGVSALTRKRQKRGGSGRLTALKAALAGERI